MLAAILKIQHMSLDSNLNSDRMKRFLIILSTIILGFTSCELKEELYINIDADTYITNAASARNVLWGVYRNMGTNSLYGRHLSIMLDMPTDVSRVDEASDINGRDVCWNAHTADNNVILEVWSGAYKVIYQANDFLEKVSAAKADMREEDQAKVDIYMVEARAIRALMYFELVRLFGGVTLMTTTEQSYQHPSTFERDSPEEIYSFIEGELEDCSRILPWAQKDSLRSDNSFMFSKAAALGLNARVYATHAGYPLRDETKWEKCDSCCREIISAGHNSLLPEYEKLWENCCNGVWDPSEALIQICFYSPVWSSQSSQNNSGYIGKWNGVHIVSNSSNLIRVDARQRALTVFMADWKDYDKDLRWGLSAADYSYDGLTQVPMDSKKSGEKIPFTAVIDGSSSDKNPYKKGLYIAKYDLTKYVAQDKQLRDGNYSNANWYVMRYADVLLLHAEAQNELNNGPTEDAYNSINMVRRRGFGQEDLTAPCEAADIAPGLDYTGFLKAIRDERAYELCFEGNRKQDLIRWGIYYETIDRVVDRLNGFKEEFGSKYSWYWKTVKGKHELQPIPQREKDLMIKYDQNPNW